jgi:thiamine biosynthesis lipoprotein
LGPAGEGRERHRFAHEAMATIFEVIVAGETARYAGQAAQAAFREIDRIERLLSRYDPASDVSQINRLRPGEAARIGFDAFECLEMAWRLHRETRGAFDATVGALVALWRDSGLNAPRSGNAGAPPGVSRASRPPAEPLPPHPAHSSTEDGAVAWRRVGVDRLELTAGEREDGPKEFTVRFLPGEDAPADAPEGPLSAGGTDGEPKRPAIDLGGIGKGYALDRAAEALREWSIESALVHSGGSTALAIGAPPGEKGWPVGVGGDHESLGAVGRILLKHGAVSGSGTEQQGAHIIDPRTGRPVTGNRSAWARCSCAAEADALSTAFMVMTPCEIEAFCAARRDVAAMTVIEHASGGGSVFRFGPWED